MAELLAEVGSATLVTNRWPGCYLSGQGYFVFKMHYLNGSDANQDNVDCHNSFSAKSQKR